MPIDTNQARPRQIDYLVYITDECTEKLNEWEVGFVASCIKWLRRGYDNTLSQKQVVILNKMIVKFGLINDEYCVRGYADRTNEEVLRDGGTGTQSTKMAQANDDFEDDFEDDIPF